ncbi:Protein of unknown function [Pyronema omphalodes CBS 100304]|uniref:Uncharacterized protein n=1 Tax=Pyronema omphalodes (strain CBS 100304) TaxID=1076935 RepID=U4LC40_PYROM|nr:Protein of unknown function [Pyronema omphalodes CBS 100304]
MMRFLVPRIYLVMPRKSQVAGRLLSAPASPTKEYGMPGLPGSPGG